jgi:phosphoribosylaminoimidazole (AIR) synthetase
MAVVVSEARADAVRKTLQDAGETVYRIGRIEPREGAPIVLDTGAAG